jgi:predicted DNA-binding protein (UPF0251 family)
MPRPKLIRKISKLPHFKGFRPIGIEENGHVVVLNYEEYEAIKLSDYQMLGQFCASEIMGVSRPTYTRIYEVARRKIAKAFTEGLPIVFEGGKVYFDSEWFSCSSCGCMFNHHKEGLPERCSLCGSADVKQFPWDSKNK